VLFELKNVVRPLKSGFTAWSSGGDCGLDATWSDLPPRAQRAQRAGRFSFFPLTTREKSARESDRCNFRKRSFSKWLKTHVIRALLKVHRKKSKICL